VVYGVNTIDSNLIFGTVGIGPATGALTSFKVAAEGGTVKSNSQQKYVFSFKTQAGIDKSSFIKIKLPTSIFQLGKLKRAQFYSDDKQISREVNVINQEGYLVTEKVGLSVDPLSHLNLEVTLVTSVVYSVF